MINLRQAMESPFGMMIPWLNAGNPFPAEISSKAVYWYFGDLIKQRIADALDEQDWPQDAMPVAERLKLAEKLDGEIEELNSERDTLAAQLESAGFKG
jgi:hypothetical protein